ncbi:hypothetical protein [Thermococcus celer]|uniref:Uncharacterized protein n=1 Tax=Thermococcus celer Vu 13 = JCM 8558 TaxID=1293037 RepID=A0A218P130_THECE|nr:hypothetical protein [Thermococcus celer]ASI98639.1 hypothetical protein A3L02_03185 [Thermococcus celer Vu 13 = JCM 8558]
MSLPELRCFDYLLIERPKISSRRISARYVLGIDGEERAYKLMHTYEERIPRIEAFAKLMSIVPAINYGLFTPEIRFDFTLDPRDMRFFRDMMEVTAKDIFVNRIANPSEFVRPEVVPKSLSPGMAEPMAELVPLGVEEEGLDLEPDPSSSAVMLSGGKESLLTYGLMKELGNDVYPLFYNESGAHWHVAIPAYRWFKENEPNTKRVWSNVDRLYSFIERNMRILRGVGKRKSEVYPIRLFFFEGYAFAFLPLIYKYGIGNVLFGNEYDDPRGYAPFHGIEHYNATYDQSQDFEKYMTRWFNERGLKVRQWSAVRPLTGLIVERILHDRYPHLFRLQRSCHSVHKEGDDYLPCGTCFKCNGIMTFLLANGIDLGLIGYRDWHVSTLPDRLRKGLVRLDRDELEHSLHLIKRNFPEFPLKGKPHWHVEMIHFDGKNSHIDNVPPRFRGALYSIFEGYTKGYVYLKGDRWIRITREEALGDVPPEL